MILKEHQMLSILATLVALPTLFQPIRCGSKHQSASQDGAGCSRQTQGSADCPSTPDWSDQNEKIWAPFIERYRDVHFEAPESHFFDESTWAEGDPVSWKDSSSKDISPTEGYPTARCHSPISGHGASRSSKDFKVLIHGRLEESSRRQDSADQADINLTDSDHTSDDEDISNSSDEHDLLEESTRRVSHPHGNHSKTESQRRVKEMRTTISPEEREEYRKKFDQYWDKMGLRFDMEAQELALGVARIKIIWRDLEDASIGLIASSKVKKHTCDNYFKQYRLASGRYSKKMCSLKKSINEGDLASASELDRRRYLWKKIGTLRNRSFGLRTDNSRVNSRVSVRSTEAESNRRALVAGAALKQIVQDAYNTSNIDLQTLTMPQIEYYSRNLVLPEMDLMASTISLKRYLKKYLRISDSDLADFSIKRIDHHNQIQEDLKQDRKLKKKMTM